jgi:hypothetical protein
VAEKWLIEREGEVYGPADASELTQWIEEGRLDANDLLWPEKGDRRQAVPAETVLRSLGLTLGRAPVVDLGAAEVYDLGVMDLGAEDQVVDLGAVDQLQLPAGGPKPVPDWVLGLAAAVDADRRKPRTSPRPDWLDDVRQAEQALQRRPPTPGGDKAKG